ncbi:hypothetical protein PPERSA_02931 [Pseudocohnilembus persalinus]|uniref:Insulin-like growth factor binding protein, N-terminal n=1 Tax=Pseudocohnilembus persalinus TaxID=266149 RepID=A0A0V0QAA4_PSEPJ|nr:hypothetical protein PPERSA_02931 [Pseudocohnilembus persalinus]|eukprot:KRW99099.1 hypothetical protein PPERSA_02931 [Pseudocohnilembus persalinus]
MKFLKRDFRNQRLFTGVLREISQKISRLFLLVSKEGRWKGQDWTFRGSWEGLGQALGGGNQGQFQELVLDFSESQIDEVGGLVDVVREADLGKLERFELYLNNVRCDGESEQDGENSFDFILENMSNLKSVLFDFSQSNFVQDFKYMTKMLSPVTQTLTNLQIVAKNVEFSSLQNLALTIFQLQKGKLTNIDINLSSDFKQSSQDFDALLASFQTLPQTIKVFKLNVSQILPQTTNLRDLFIFIGNQKENLENLSLNFGYAVDLKGIDQLQLRIGQNTNLVYLELLFPNCQQLDYENLALSVNNALKDTKLHILSLDLSSTLRQVLTANTAQEQADLFFSTVFDVDQNNLNQLNLDFSHNTKVVNYKFLGNSFKKLKNLVQINLVIKNSNLGDISAISQAFKENSKINYMTLNFAYSTVDSMDPLDDAFSAQKLNYLNLNVDFMGLQEVEFMRQMLQTQTELLYFILSAELNNISDLSPFSTAFIKTEKCSVVQLNLLGNTNIIDISPLEYSFINLFDFSLFYLDLPYQDGEIDYSPLNTILYNQYGNLLQFRLIKVDFKKTVEFTNYELEAMTWDLVYLNEQNKRFYFTKNEAQVQECENSSNLCTDCSQEAGKCSQCVGNLKSSECSVCEEGNFMSEISGLCYTCSTLVDYCGSCQSEYVCLSCKQDYKLNEYGICYQETCLQQNCGKCSQNNSEICLQCAQGYDLQEDGSCKPQNCGLAQENEDFFEGCDFCPFEGICSACSSNYKLLSSGRCQVESGSGAKTAWIIIGSILGVLVVGGGVWYFVYKKKQDKGEEDESNTSGNNKLLGDEEDGEENRQSLQ